MATVDQLQSTALGFANGFVTDAKNALNEAAAAIQAIDEGDIDYAIPLAQSFQEPAAITRPVLHSVGFDIPAEPGLSADLTNISTIVFDPIPSFDLVAPELSFPSRPAEIGAFNETAPVIDVDSLVFPNSPDQLNNIDYNPPVLKDRTEPIAPSIVLPNFDEVAPSGDIGALGDVTGQYAANYHTMVPEMMSVIESKVDGFVTKYNPQFHQQQALIEAQLAKYFSGGTALSPAIENQQHERTRDKINAEYLRAISTAEQGIARRGFTMPPGAMAGALQSLRKDAGDNNARAAVEISVNQAEMEQRNLQFAVTTSAQVRSQMLGSALAHEQGMITLIGQSMEYAQQISGFMIQAYNAKISGVQLQVQIFQAKAQVFETLLRRATAAIEIYKAEIDALQALTNVDRTKIEAYTARINGLQSLALIYKTQVDAVVSQAELQKIKLDLFRTKAETYSVQVNAKSAEYQAYSAQINGEEAKLRVYATQADVYSKKLEAYKVKADTQSTSLNAEIKRNEAILSQYASQVQTFSTIVNARGEVARVDLENQRQMVIAYQAESSAAIAIAQTRASYYQSINQVGIEQARLFTQQSLEKGRLKLNKTQAIAQASVSIGNVYEQAAGAAMSGTISLAAQTMNSSS